MHELLEGLEPDPDRMRANLDITGGLLMTESVVTALTPSMGRGAAQELVGGAVRRAVQEGRPVRDVLLDLPEVASELGERGVDAAFAPEGYLGLAGDLIDRALTAHGA
jgi:3-carboxy-cis,cis-muconate cycloisomerase